MNISAQVIDTIVEWIDDNLHQPLRIDDIARHAGYSKWHLQRLFLQYKGESLGRYIRERKLLLAARDLRDTDQRVYDICLKYGFDSQQTFTRIFTRIWYCAGYGAAGRVSQREPQPCALSADCIPVRLYRRAFFALVRLNLPARTSGAISSAIPDTQLPPALRTTGRRSRYRAG